MDSTCQCGYCGKCHAAKWLMLGIVLVLVRWYYPQWDIWLVLGVLVLLKGVMRLIMPSCGHCKTEMRKGKR